MCASIYLSVYLARPPPPDEPAHIVLDAVLEEVDKVREAEREAKERDGASGHATAEAAAVDVRVGRARLAVPHAGRRREAEQRDDVEDGREQRLECEVVPAD